MSDRSPNQEYWDSFYGSRAESLVPDAPSPFAQWAVTRLDPSRTIVEFGFGTARDTVWFAAHGHRVRGFDFAESAVALASARAASSGTDALFSVVDLYDPLQLEDLLVTLTALGVSPVVYGRFLLHSLEDPGRHNLFDFMSRLPLGCDFLFEFRTGQDADAQHVFGDDHFRRYLDPEVVAEEISERGGETTLSIAGHGLATYKTEDPHVARLAGRWPSPKHRPQS